jgi:hypothetical protein
MKLKTIYIITEGEYSDYHVKGAALTKEGAYAFVAKFGGDIEEIQDQTPHLKAGYNFYNVLMEKDGGIRKVSQQEETYWCNLYFYDQLWGERLKTPVLSTYCWAKDDKHAIKIVNERRTQILAAELWNKTDKCALLFPWA